MALSPELYREAVLTWHRPLLRYFLVTTRAPLQDAEDLVHRTFEALWRRREVYEPKEPGEQALRAWLFGLALRERLLFHRAASRQNHALSRLTEGDPSLLEPQVLERILTLLPSGQARLSACLAQLRRLDRQILGLSFGLELEQEGPDSPLLLPMPDRTLAETLQTLTGQPWRPSRVKMARHRALAWLRSCLAKEHPPASLPEVLP